MNRTAGVIPSNRLKRPERHCRQGLEKLNQKEKKDQVVTFEELGVDHLYVDEAHSYKNAFLYTKNEECSWDCTERSTEVGGYVQ